MTGWAKQALTFLDFQGDDELAHIPQCYNLNDWRTWIKY